MKIPSEQNLANDPAKAAKRRLLPHGILPLVVLGVVVVVFAALLLPIFNTVTVRQPRSTKIMGQAKMIGLALNLYATDNDGNYPRRGFPAELLTEPENSNQAFASLLPIYTQSEKIFGNSTSAYQSKAEPDDIIDNP